MTWKLFKILSLVSLAALILAACGSDSGNGAEADATAEVKTIYGLGECKGANEGVTKLVTSENRYYTCEEGYWESFSDTAVIGRSSSSRSTPKSSDSEGCDDPWLDDDEVESSDSESGDGDNKSSSSRYSEASDNSAYDVVTGTFTDSRDGQVYRTTTITDRWSYSEVWMAENLNYETDNSCCYFDKSGNCANYGRLYTWFAAVGRTENKCDYGNVCNFGEGDVRGVCPEGWHLPSSVEWNRLFTAVGGDKTAGTMLKSTSGWLWYEWYGKSGNGTDTYSFSALPAGYYELPNGTFHDEGNIARFWSSTESEYEEYAFSGQFSKDSDASVKSSFKYWMYSVRCLKDKEN